MLQKLREQSNRWYIKALFLLIVISFGMFGVGDIVLNYVNMRPVATVDGHNITQEEFSMRLQNMVGKAQEMSKGQLSSEQIRGMGIPQKILDSLIDQFLIMSELKKRNVVVTDTVVRRRIQSIPTFLNEQGAFDKRAFDYLLHNNHITEPQFVADVRTELQQHQLFGALFAGMHLPKTYVDLLFKGFFEQRVFAVVTVPLSKMVVKESPKQGDLEEFYRENQAEFTRPEMRKITLLEIDPKFMKDQIIVPLDKLQEEYERRKAEFEIAEKREIKQINLKDEEAAKKAVESLKKGRPVPAVARDQAGEFKDLGLVTKQQLPDLVAERLFEAELGQVTGPISTPFGWQVYVVSKIEPSFIKSFIEIRGQLESELKVQIANDQIYELKNKIEDALAGGATLAEIAKEHNLKMYSIENVSKFGKDEADKYVLPESGRADILDQAFSLPENADSPVIDTKEGVSYVIHVDAIKPAHVPPFEKVKDKVSQAWVQERRFNLSAIVAEQLVKDARSVSDLSRLALGRKLSIKMLDPLSRVDAEKDEKIHKQFTPKLIAQMFELKPGKAVYGLSPDRTSAGEIQIIMLQKVLPFNQNTLKEKRQQIEKKFSDLAYQDAVALYVKSLRSVAKISVNQAIYDSMVNRG
jgi:peptidyl-prolyl cis-trans isomerase D